MNKEIAQQWVEALKSGKYQQTYRTLRRERKDGTCAFCGMGVLCDISELGEWNYSGQETFGYKVGNEQTDGQLPQEVKDWAGMESVTGMRAGLGRSSITQLNDLHLYTFDQLAVVIERDYKDL